MSGAVGQEGLYHPFPMEAIAERGETYKSCVAPLHASRFAPAPAHLNMRFFLDYCIALCDVWG
jgi:hypothetical protein